MSWKWDEGKVYLTTPNSKKTCSRTGIDEEAYGIVFTWAETKAAPARREPQRIWQRPVKLGDKNLPGKGHSLFSSMAHN